MRSLICLIKLINSLKQTCKINQLLISPRSSHMGMFHSNSNFISNLSRLSKTICIIRIPCRCLIPIISILISKPSCSLHMLQIWINLGMACNKWGQGSSNNICTHLSLSSTIHIIPLPITISLLLIKFHQLSLELKLSRRSSQRHSSSPRQPTPTIWKTNLWLKPRRNPKGAQGITQAGKVKPED